MAEKLRLIIVDDDPSMRQGLRMILEGSNTEVLAEADNGRTGVEQAMLLQPELVLLDISMPVMGGFAAAQQLKQSMPELRIIFVSQHSERIYIDEAMRIGVNGYVLKQTAASELGNAIEAVMTGGRFLSSRLVA